MDDRSLHDPQALKKAHELTIKRNIMKLGDKDGLVREKARKNVVKMGRLAVDFLLELETHPKKKVRWEAVKALGEIDDPITAPALVNALEDDSGDVRWLAAEGLAHLGETGLRAVLEALLAYPETVYLRKGAHHVLSRMASTTSKPIIRELLNILNDSDAELKVPLMIKSYIEKLESGKNKP